MNEEIRFNHVGLQCDNKEKAELFFTKVLGLPRVKDYTLTEELSESIFGIRKAIEMIVYDNGRIKIEAFINENNKNSTYGHICIEVKSKDEFIEICNEYGIKPIVVRKDDKNLLFIRDFSGNLFEIKELPLYPINPV